MLRNRQGQIVALASNFQFGVDYDHKNNEMVGRGVRDFDHSRRDLRESKSPLPFPKGNMFSIEQRARIVQ
jgi:hypothetical protein